MTLHDLPAINATLNATSAVFLALGYVFIKRQKKIAHRNCMIAAFCISTVFLGCYLTYHYLLRQATGQSGTPFQGQGWVRPVYFTILISHIILAVVIVPLIFITLNRAWKERFELHKKIARWTWPLWMYVSVTGVIVYVMLYHLYPAK